MARNCVFIEFVGLHRGLDLLPKHFLSLISNCMLEKNAEKHVQKRVTMIRRGSQICTTIMSTGTGYTQPLEKSLGRYASENPSVVTRPRE